ncbi:hypothetical protein PHJA_000994200 [Phtheirospermum japonicum]|uniref:Cystatin domain-containing protein n=1 Tax=Phtheirospermum japonicum TaxID=374723 RepID=A0A830BZ45_9LAMI|nr:hypothetical protein PHJA_000994200 [Phtheirospermum japonicum]
MAITSRSLLFAFFIILAFSDEVIGKLQQINKLNPYVQKVAKFAITEQNRLAKKHLIIINVVNATKEETPVAIVYQLTVSVKDRVAARAKNYLAVVWDMKMATKMILKSFKENI